MNILIYCHGHLTSSTWSGSPSAQICTPSPSTGCHCCIGITRVWPSEADQTKNIFSDVVTSNLLSRPVISCITDISTTWGSQVMQGDSDLCREDLGTFRNFLPRGRFPQKFSQPTHALFFFFFFFFFEKKVFLIFFLHRDSIITPKIFIGWV